MKLAHQPQSSLVALLAAVLLTSSLRAEVPPLLNYQGHVAVGGVNFDSMSAGVMGKFRFALVDTAGTTTFWSNDDTSVAGSEPTDAVKLAVTKGLFTVLLGDTGLTNMTAIPPEVFQNADVRLRIWFDDGVNGSLLLSPDQRVAAAGYAMNAAGVLLADVVAPPVKPVMAWGDNDDGQTTVPALAGVASVAAGGTHSLALLKAGTVVKWGEGAAVPEGLAGVTGIAAGAAHNLAVKSDGTVAAWGDAAYGKTAVPGGLTNATHVAAGEKHSLALRADGTVAVWGDDSFDQTTIPGTATNVTAIAAGYDHSLALKADGTVAAWGRNNVGQCDVPGGLNDVTAIAAGAYHSLAVKSDGTVIAWGWDLGGQITVPAGLTGVSKIAGGYAFSIALKTDGTLVAWGDNTDGQIAIPSGATRITAVAAGPSHVLALRADLIPAQVARLDQDNVFTDKLGIKRTATTNALEVEGQASKSIAGNWIANSDRRIKSDIEPVTGALEKLGQVRLVDFRYTPDYRATHPGIADKRYLNVIAQEFAEVFPDHVQSSGEKLPDGSAILQVDTYPLTIYSAAAVQELHRENEALKAALAEQQKKLADQEQRLRKLEAALQ